MVIHLLLFRIIVISELNVKANMQNPTCLVEVDRQPSLYTMAPEPPA